jgi:hypothetical protein
VEPVEHLGSRVGISFACPRIWHRVPRGGDGRKLQINSDLPGSAMTEIHIDRARGDKGSGR